MIQPTGLPDMTVSVRGGRNAFEHELAALGTVQKNSRGNHPQTQGKVERFHQTMKNWLRRQPDPPATIQQLQTSSRPSAISTTTNAATDP